MQILLTTQLYLDTHALAAEPDDTDEFLVSDAGTIKRIDYSLKSCFKVVTDAILHKWFKRRYYFC